MSEITEIKKSLQPLFKKALSEDLWFNSVYQDMWFHPDELRKAQSEGRYIWGPENWKLRNPQERLDQLYEEKRNIDKAIETLKRRM